MSISFLSTHAALTKIHSKVMSWNMHGMEALFFNSHVILIYVPVAKNTQMKSLIILGPKRV